MKRFRKQVGREEGRDLVKKKELKLNPIKVIGWDEYIINIEANLKQTEGG